MHYSTNRPDRPSPNQLTSHSRPTGRSFPAGFTIVELLVVIIVIGLLATLGVIGYANVRQKAVDTSVLSDLDGLDVIETRYGLKTNTESKPWNSASGLDTDLAFTPSKGNVIEVSTNNGKGYCIKGYNPQGSNYKTIDTAARKESNPGSCRIIHPPFDAYISSTQDFNVPTGVTQVILQVWGGRGGDCNHDLYGTGGTGGYAKGTLAVAPTDTLHVNIGVNGYDTVPIYEYCSATSDGTGSWINRPAAGMLLQGVGGQKSHDCDCTMDPRYGLTYGGLTDVATGTSTYSTPPHAVITYTPPPTE